MATIATRTARKSTTTTVHAAGPIAPASSVAPARPTLDEAREMVRRHAARRYEQARIVFESLRLGIEAGAEVDPALDQYLELACAEVVEAESALVRTILAAQHEGELAVADDLDEIAHEDDFFACDGRMYWVEIDPAQAWLEVGERGDEGRVMILTVRDDPMARAAGMTARWSRRD